MTQIIGGRVGLLPTRPPRCAAPRTPPASKAGSEPISGKSMQVHLDGAIANKSQKIGTVVPSGVDCLLWLCSSQAFSAKSAANFSQQFNGVARFTKDCRMGTRILRLAASRRLIATLNPKLGPTSPP